MPACRKLRTRRAVAAFPNDDLRGTLGAQAEPLRSAAENDGDVEARELCLTLLAEELPRAKLLYWFGQLLEDYSAQRIEELPLPIQAEVMRRIREPQFH